MVHIIIPRSDGELIQLGIKARDEAAAIEARLKEIVPYAEKRIRPNDLKLEQIWVIEEQLHHLAGDLNELARQIDCRIRNNEPAKEFIKKM